MNLRNMLRKRSQLQKDCVIILTWASLQTSLFSGYCLSSVISLLLSLVSLEHSPLQMNSVRGFESMPRLLPYNRQGNCHLICQFQIKYKDLYNNVIVALFLIAKIWNQFKFSSIREGINCDIFIKCILFSDIRNELLI